MDFLSLKLLILHISHEIIDNSNTYLALNFPQVIENPGIRDNIMAPLIYYRMFRLADQREVCVVQGVLALCEFHYCEFHYCSFSKLLLKFG